MDVRIGLIGYGGWGSHHASALASTRGVALQAISSRSPESCENARANYPQTDVHDDLFDLIARDDLDAIDIVLPNSLHFPVVKLVLEAGKHVLVEKPLALQVEQCQELVRLASARGLTISVAHTMRLSPLWGRVKLLIDNGWIGEPRSAWLDLWRVPYREGVDGWRYSPEMVGNWLLEGPIHLFDLARWYLSPVGEPESLFARANSRDPEHTGLEYNFTAQLDFPRGAQAVISQTTSGFEHRQSVRITGTRGALTATWHGTMDRTRSPVESLRLFDGNQIEEIALDRPSGEMLELREFMYATANSIRDGYALPVSATDACWAVSLCEAARRSITSGLPVVLSPPN